MIRRINQRRAVFEAYLLSLCVLTGATSFFAPPARAKSIVYSFPTWAQGLWYIGVMTGGLIGLYGIMAKQVDTGLVVERAAMWLLIGLTASYGVAAVAYQGPSALPAMMTLFGFTGIAVVRVSQINEDLAALQLHLEARADEAS